MAQHEHLMTYKVACLLAIDKHHYRYHRAPLVHLLLTAIDHTSHTGCGRTGALVC